MVIVEDGVASLSVLNSAALSCLEFQSHWAASVPGVFGGRGLGFLMGCVWHSRNVVGSQLPLGLLAPICGVCVGSRGRTCVRGVKMGWVGSMSCACACGCPGCRGEHFLLPYLEYQRTGYCKSWSQGFIGRAVLALYNRADEIRCETVSVEGMGELIKGHNVSGPDFAAKQGCEFISVNNMGAVVVSREESLDMPSSMGG
eukprot:1160830-Pelagomonas_calceolata.AAC.2